jgi:PEP-CTERM motif
LNRGVAANNPASERSSFNTQENEMRASSKLTLALLASAAAAAIPATTRANINGFGDFSSFTVNQNDTGSSPTIPSPGTIELTNAGSEVRSIFADAPQNISQFTASFGFQATNVSGFNSGRPGAMLVLQNDSRQGSAVGNSSDNYGFSGIGNSVGISLDLVSDTTGLFTNGNIGSGAASVSPVNLASGDLIDVQVTYSGSTLTESLFDTVTSASFTTTDFVLPGIPTTVGGDTAFVGLATGTSSRALAGADEYFSNFQFNTSVPEPSSIAVIAVGTLGCLRRRRYQR